MLMNLAIIGCFCLSALLVYLATAFLVDLIFPYPVDKKKKVNPAENQIPDTKSAKTELDQIEKTEYVNSAPRMNLRELKR